MRWTIQSVVGIGEEHPARAGRKNGLRSFGSKMF
jgi:hypothetical protein